MQTGIEHDFTFDIEEYRIKHNPLSTKVYRGIELYSWHQDFMERLENLDIDVGMQALGERSFKIVNGWKIDPICLEWLNDSTIDGIRVDGKYILPGLPPSARTRWTPRISISKKWY